MNVIREPHQDLETSGFILARRRLCGARSAARTAPIALGPASLRRGVRRPPQTSRPTGAALLRRDHPSPAVRDLIAQVDAAHSGNGPNKRCRLPRLPWHELRSVLPRT